MGNQLRQITDPATRLLLETIIRNLTCINDNITALNTAEAPGWLDIPLQSGWKQKGSSYELPQFYKDLDGTVHLKGVITSGTTTDDTTIGALPAEYRPDRRWFIATNEGGRIAILPSGNMQIYDITANDNVFISGSFVASR